MSQETRDRAVQIVRHRVAVLEAAERNALALHQQSWARKDWGTVPLALRLAQDSLVALTEARAILDELVWTL